MERIDDLNVVRWRRYGNDRLYVNDPSGNSIGWVDVATGQRFLSNSAWAPAFDGALSIYHSAQVTTPRMASAPASPGVPPSAPPAPTDLAFNAPGQAAFARAQIERDAAPVRTFLARLFGVHTNERAWRIGATGERKVAAQLGKLDSRWQVLHSIPVGAGDSDIDHLVIGPGGVFTLNAKHHPNASVWSGGDVFMVNGQRQPYVRNARYEAERARRLLSRAVGYDLPVFGVVVVVGAAKGFKVRAQPDDGQAFVVGRRELVRWLRRQPTRLASHHVDQIFAAARRPDLWHD